LETAVPISSVTRELLIKKRLFTVLSDQVKDSEFYDQNLYDKLIAYADAYIVHHKLTPKEVSKSYLSFIKEYNKDARLFDETGQYPLELDADRGEPSRTAYSIILLLSTLLTFHRLRIMQLIQNKTELGEAGLFIGCGPGLEIDLVRSKFTKLVAYDLTLDPFLRGYYFDSVDFRNAYFEGNGKEKYSHIYLIELLEHLADPYEILINCKKVLDEKGQLFLTTATNIPQFDHLYNFPADHMEFDEKLMEMGYSILYSEDIVHDYMTKSIGSANKFYILTH